MSQRITPLTRNQLLELEALVRSLIAAVTQPLPPQHNASAGDQSWPSSAPTTPASLTTSSSAANKARAMGTDGSAFTGLSNSAEFSAVATASSSSYRGDDHAVLHGTFIDVFHDPFTATAWRLYDKILYLVWWSYRPPLCTNCGMQDAWMPSGDVEFKCAFCITGAGTTRSNAIVEDDTAVNEEADYGNHSSDEDDAADDKDKTVVGGSVGTGGGAGGGPIDSYLFFYEWLQRVPLLTAAATILHHHQSGSGSGNPNLPEVGSANNTGAASSTNSMRAGRSGQQHHHHRPQQTAIAASNASSSVMLPTGEALPAVLRAAYDMSILLTAPGLPQGTAPVIRAAALYMSLLLHRYVSLFPLFCVAGRVTAAPRVAPAAATSVRGGEWSSTTNAPPHPSHITSLDSAEGLQSTEVELQWIDVELVCSLLGVAAPSFFESAEVSMQHLQNVFTVAAAYGVPSVLWHPGRVPGRVDVMKTLRDKAIPLCPLHTTTAGVSGLSPEHTAMVVALEFARRVDEHPIAASSTSPAAAAQNAQRIGMWFDALGLYPTRHVYRDVHSFLQVVAQEEAEEAAGKKKRGTKDEMSNVKSEDDGHCAREEKGRGHDTTQAWEATLTELAAVKDKFLIAAAERHAHRHDPSTAAAATVGSSSSPSLLLPLDTKNQTSTLHLTTQRSPFYKHFEWILTSPCANALLHIFAAVFHLTPMELADMALRSGVYQGHASGFVATLRSAILRGAFDVMPLARRLSPLTSSWMAAYMALHSGDRLPLLATLFQFNDGQNSTRDRQAALTRLLQKILRKHHAAQLYQLNFVLRVTDDDEKHFNGIYFLSHVLWQEGLAVFTCLRSGRKTITLNRFAHTLSLCYMNAKEKIVSRLNMHVVSPVVAAVETDAARLVMEVALGAVARGVSTQGDPWGMVVRSLDKCARVRRRMRVPMLASRLDALASIRENVNTVVVRRYPQLPAFGGGGGGVGAASAAGLVAMGDAGRDAGMMTTLGSTLLGWGETETLLAAAPQLDVRQLRRDLQWNYLALPNASLLSGLSENRVVAMYASLVGILELIQARLLASPFASAAEATTEVSLNNWVEELLFMEEVEEEAVETAPHDLMNAYSNPFSMPDRSGPGWSPPMYRNNRGGTPKLSRSPKSKFIAVSTATNNSSNGNGTAAPTSAFTTSYASGGANVGRSSRYAPTPPQTFARAPYTMTPPSMAPSRSPVLRSAATTSSTTPPLPSTRGPQGSNWRKCNGNSGSSFTITSSSHNTVSTPITRFQAPPSTSLTTLGSGGSRGPSRTPPLTCIAGDDAPPSGVLPELELSASTADVEKRLLSGAKATQQKLLRRRAGRRRGRDESDGEASSGNDDDDKNDGRGDVRREGRGIHTTSGQGKPPEATGVQQQQTQQKVLLLLQQALPPYWEVLLGLATELALPSSALSAERPAATRGSLVDEDDDEEEGGGRGGDTRQKFKHTRERRLRRPHQHQHSSGGDNDFRARFATATTTAATAAGSPTAAALHSEIAITHRPFNLFDAEECRRRLHRLYVFIGTYIECKQRLQEQAAAGTLPTLPDRASSHPPLTAASVKPAGSPPTPMEAGEAAAAAAAGCSNNNLRSPRTPLTPPPPYPTTVGQPTGISENAAGAGGGGGRDALQRSSPHQRPSPPLAPKQQRSPRGRPRPSPPLTPELCTTATANIITDGNTSSAQLLARHGSGSTSPVPLSPSPTSSRRNGGAGGGGGGGSSPNHSQQQQQPATALTPSTRSSPPQQNRRAKGGITVSSGNAERGAVRSRGGHERTAVALVDDEEFALPPSATSWAERENTTPTTGTGKWKERNEVPRSDAADQPSSPCTASSPREERHHTHARPQAVAGATSRDSPISTTTSDRGINEERHVEATVTPPQPSRKRARGADSKSNSSNSSSSSSNNSDGGAREEEGDDQLPPPQLKLRRKAKKLGRRRRRQEQNFQYQQQQTSKALLPSRSSNGDSSQEPSRSPEVRARCNGKISGSVSPLGNSPVLPPRSDSKSDPSCKLQKTRTSRPGSPTQQQRSVPSIRARVSHCFPEAPASASFSASHSLSPTSSDSGRGADYDTDAS
jgi:hypothetical protein